MHSRSALEFLQSFSKVYCFPIFAILLLLPFIPYVASFIIILFANVNFGVREATWLAKDLSTFRELAAQMFALIDRVVSIAKTEINLNFFLRNRLIRAASVSILEDASCRRSRHDEEGRQRRRRVWPRRHRRYGTLEKAEVTHATQYLKC